MEIKIITQGRGDESHVFFNGVEQNDLVYFEFSVNTERSNKAKMSTMRVKNRRLVPESFFADDFRKFDEAKENSKKEGDYNVIGNKNPGT